MIKANKDAKNTCLLFILSENIFIFKGFIYLCKVTHLKKKYRT